MDNPIYGNNKSLQVSPCRRAWRLAYLNRQISQNSSPSAYFALVRQTNQGHPQPVLVLVLTRVWTTQKDTMPQHEEPVLSADY